MKLASPTQQADILANYLLKRPVTEPVVYRLYETSIANTPGPVKEKRLIAFAFSHPVAIPFLDAGLVFIRPTSELRRRIYIMFSILEASPHHAELFLPGNHRFFEVVSVLASGIRAVFRALVGIIIIKVVRL